ncbi:hypothetical protein [Roseomonas sp. USHLN139]|uniref:hypothetical protein n=1 Tax=Roseomonas sp. USHLN139 TaxID=3081298 RepID=UPI003B02AED1
MAARLAEAEAVLRFYADRASYCATGGYARPIDRDLGRRAAQYLGTDRCPFEAAAEERDLERMLR